MLALVAFGFCLGWLSKETRSESSRSVATQNELIDCAVTVVPPSGPVSEEDHYSLRTVSVTHCGEGLEMIHERNDRPLWKLVMFKDGRQYKVYHLQRSDY